MDTKAKQTFGHHPRKSCTDLWALDDMQVIEGRDVVDAIYSDTATNYGIWYVKQCGKKAKRKSILKFQESGRGGLAEVKCALDKTKVSIPDSPYHHMNVVQK